MEHTTLNFVQVTFLGAMLTHKLLASVDTLWNDINRFNNNNNNIILGSSRKNIALNSLNNKKTDVYAKKQQTCLPLL
jgi:hypothetical protein